jgi:hypothetical protein
MGKAIITPPLKFKDLPAFGGARGDQGSTFRALYLVSGVRFQVSASIN